jgi:hypothetical protein
LKPSPHLWIIRWSLFFLICLGLGYAAVQRYDPGHTAGLSDANAYYRMVAGEPIERREMRFRILVPYVARVFQPLTSQLVAPPRSIYLALLIANAIFLATAGCLIIAIGLRIGANDGTATLAATLYLLNFAVTNLLLASSVDAGEACLLVALTFILFSPRWWWLPVCGVVGTLAKETFVPLATAFALTWWFVSYRKDSSRLQRLLPVAVMVIAMLITLVAIRLTLANSVELSAILETTHAGGPGWMGRLAFILSPTIWYVFLWLVPLGLPRLSQLPKPWVMAVIASAIVALALGIYRDIGGNVARPLFDVLGPVLSLSAALWLSKSGLVEKLTD